MWLCDTFQEIQRLRIVELFDRGRLFLADKYDTKVTVAKVIVAKVIVAKVTVVGPARYLRVDDQIQKTWTG